MSDPYSIYPDPYYDFKISHDDRFIAIAEGMRSTSWERAQQFATKVFDTREKAFRDTLIAMGWTPPGD
jgi:hypothetical protein